MVRTSNRGHLYREVNSFLFFHVTGAYFVKAKLPSPHFYLHSQFLFEVKISVSLTSLSSCFSNYIYLKMGHV